MALRAFDVTHWGFFRFRGPDVKKFLQGLVSADMEKLTPGVMLAACVLTPKGMLVADCELYQTEPVIVLAVVRPAAIAGFTATFEKKMMLSESKMDMFRPRNAWLVIGKKLPGGLPWDRFGEPACLLLDAPLPPAAHLMSVDEFETFRIASGFPIYGLDMNAQTLALEARQDAGVSLDKGCYMGQETMSRLGRVGHVNRILVGLDFTGGAPVRGAVLTRDGVETGKITSVADGRALAMVRAADHAPGTALRWGDVIGQVRYVKSWPKPIGLRE